MTKPADVSEQQARKVAEDARQSEWRKPSFGKELFLGRLRLDLIDPWPVAPTRPDAADFLAKLEVYLRTEVDGARIEREARIPDEVFHGLARLGAFGMKIDKQYGGLGLSNLDYCRALTLIGSVSPAVGALLSAHQSIGVPQPLKIFGSPAQKQAFLPRLAAGEVSAFLLTEPDVGSDPARLGTIAEAVEGGYRLNGVKLWATNGTVATLLVVMARVPGKGITAFVVEGDSDGITVERRNEFLGLRGLENSVTRFHDVFVPEENVIGGLGKGLKIALTTLNTGRLSLPAMCVGATKWSLGIAREWSAARVQWGHPVGRHGAVANKIAFIAATTYGLESTLDLCCAIADDDRNDVRIEAALIKLFASEMAWQAADELLQIRGGRGYETAESQAARGERAVEVEQVLRDLRINRIFEGSTEIMHLLIAREAVDQHLQVAGAVLLGDSGLADKAKAVAKAGAFYATWFPTLTTGAGQRPGSFSEFGDLARHLRYVERHSRKLARSTFYAMGRYQVRLEQKGHLLGRIVDIGAELYGITCACVYADTIAREQPNRRQQAVELADLFCGQARRRADRLFAALWANDDDGQYQAAQQVLSGRYGWFENDVLDPAGDGPMMPLHAQPATEQFKDSAAVAAPEVEAAAAQ